MNIIASIVAFLTICENIYKIFTTESNGERILRIAIMAFMLIILCIFL